MGQRHELSKQKFPASIHSYSIFSLSLSLTFGIALPIPHGRELFTKLARLLRENCDGLLEMLSFFFAQRKTVRMPK